MVLCIIRQFILVILILGRKRQALIDSVLDGCRLYRISGQSTAIIAQVFPAYCANYISQPKEKPIAAYAIDYIIFPASIDKTEDSLSENQIRSMRLTVTVIRNSANNRWIFEVLSYEFE